jgi:hypothetical protein
VLESIKEMLPKDHWWPVDAWWNFHAGRGSYGTMNVFTAALDARYGKSKGLEDFITKSQMQAYEGERAMFEAFGRNKYTSTGVIQWMLTPVRLVSPAGRWLLRDQDRQRAAARAVFLRRQFGLGGQLVLQALHRVQGHGKGL